MSYPYNQPPQYQGAPPPPPSNKGMKVLIWSLAGCGVLIITGAILLFAGGYFLVNKAKEMGFDPELMEKEPALAMGKIIAATNPEVELVTVDESKKTITLREKKTGKVMTIDLEDAQSGRIVFKEEGKDEVVIEAKGEGNTGSIDIKTAEGTARLGTGSEASIPDWVPRYPGAEITGNFSTKSDKTDSGSFRFATKDSVEEVISFYEDGLEEEGLKVKTNLLRQDGKVTLGTAVGEDSDKKRSAYINAQAVDSGAQVTVTYQVKK